MKYYDHFKKIQKKKINLPLDFDTSFIENIFSQQLKQLPLSRR